MWLWEWVWMHLGLLLALATSHGSFHYHRAPARSTSRTSAVAVALRAFDAAVGSMKCYVPDTRATLAPPRDEPVVWPRAGDPNRPGLGLAYFFRACARELAVG